MGIKYIKQIVSFMVLMTCISMVSAETEKGDIIYTDDGVPIKFGSVFVSEAIPSSTKITAREAPIVRKWLPGDPIIEIPRIHWNELKAEKLANRFNNHNPTQRDPLLDKQENSPWIRSLDPGTVNMNGQGYSGVNPPDTVGDIGLNYYVQGTNISGGSSIVIYNKDGTVATGPFNMDSLGAGNCNNGLGDPIILFDEIASRWMISEFSSSGNQLCVYISQTGDPTGAYYAYAFTAVNSFPDYPKYGVWSNAYYMGSNESSPTLYAFDRANMLLGNPATLQSINAPSLSGFGFQILTPADLDGSTPPAANAPGLFLRHRDTESHGPGTCPNAGTSDCIEIFEFNVDWGTPANSNLVGPIMIEVSEFDSNLCGLSSFSCIDQPGNANFLDPLREVMMWRVAYRNFGNYESIVGNFVTDVSGTDDAGIRWVELRNTGSGWTLQDEGTYAPDANSRWMGSAAMDESGNIAIAYNRSSSSTFPSLAYTGRLTSDPAGTMGAEQIIVAGTANNSSNRYGDYAALSIDPADGCTFWFTGQYNPSSNWNTRIANFSFSECGVSTFSMIGSNLTQSVCVNPSANLSTITLDLAPLNGFSENVSFAFSPGLPTGFASSGGFNPASLTPAGSSTVDISVNNSAASGANNFQITGTSATANKSVNVSILVTNGVPAQSTLLSPADTSTVASSSPTFSWSAVADTADYTLEIATDAGFTAIVYTTTQSGTSLALPVALPANTTHYWRVIANNGCGSGVASATFSFDTPAQVCFSTLTAIPDNSVAGVTTTINIASSGTILSALVSMDATHTWTGDLIFSLEHAGTTVNLMDRPGVPASGFGCGSDNVNTIFDDTSINIVEDQCNGTPPAIGPDSLPNEALSGFNGLDSAGNWNMTVSDNAGADTGSINEWCLDLVLDVQTYTVGGIVSGATGSVTVLNNLGDAQVIPANGAFNFAAQNDGTVYAVTVSASPATQTCTVTGGGNNDGTGTLSGSNVTDVSVSCTTDTYTVSGNVSGATGSVTVLNNLGNSQTIPANGAFNFAAQNDGTVYAVTVSASPATQTCTVTGGGNNDGTGTLVGSNVADISVSCTTDTYMVSGNVSGATGSVTVLNNLGDSQTIPANGGFSFAAQNDGTVYVVTVSASPVTQTCTVTGGGNNDGSGTLAGGDVTNVVVTCEDDFSTAVTDIPTVLEDSGINSVDVLANDSSSINGAAPITIVTQPTNGVVAITNSGNDLSYMPNAEYCNDGLTTDDFTYTITGGSSTTVSMTVTCVNDEPNYAKDNNVYVNLSDTGSPLAEIVACQFDMGPDNEDSSQNVNDFMVGVDSDPNGILSTIDVLNDGSLVATYSGAQGMATVSLTLQDDGGTTNSGDDSVTKQFSIHVQDYIFRGGFEIQTCPQ